MPVVVAVEFAERYWYPDDGGQVWLAGYQLVDPESGAYLARDAPLLAERGLHVSGVAGTQFRPGALDSEALAPGGALELRREPGNPHDANAIAVHAGGVHVGFVPRELAARRQRDRGARGGRARRLGPRRAGRRARARARRRPPLVGGRAARAARLAA